MKFRKPTSTPSSDEVKQAAEPPSLPRMLLKFLRMLLDDWKARRGRRAPIYRVTTDQDVLDAAYRSAPRRFRWLGLSLRREQFYALADNPRRARSGAREELERGAKVWPFVFNEYTLSMRRGYVLVRDGKARAVIITEVS